MKASVAYAVAVVLIYLSDRLVAERTVATLLVAQLPPLLFLLPGIALVVASFRSWRLLAVNVVILCLAAVFVAGFRIHLPSDREESLRVMSFNVQQGYAGMERVAEVIRKYEPNVVCIQEGTDSVERGLKALLPSYTCVRNESMIVLSELPVEAVRTWPPIKGKRRPFQRVQLSGPLPFFVYNVHFEPSRIEEHLGGGMFAHLMNWNATQQKEMDVISSALVDEPVILCGDFNGLPTGLRYERLTRRLRDAHDVAGIGFGNTIPAQFPFRRIDWILVSPHWQVLRAFVPKEISSDHRPMVADLELDSL